MALILAAMWGTSLTAQSGTEGREGPRFADLWIGGPLDSLYRAEFERLHAECPPAEGACFSRDLDTTAVVLTRVWTGPLSLRSAGWLVTGLRASGSRMYASLVYRPETGEEVVLREDLGDWGYGVSLPLAGVTADRLGLSLPAMDEPLWISAGQSRAFGVVEVYGLQGRLWQLSSMPARRQADGVIVELDAGVYLILDVSRGLVRLRPEIPSDMACGQEVSSNPDDVPWFEVALDRLVGPDGLPMVEKAYGRGC